MTTYIYYNHLNNLYHNITHSEIKNLSIHSQDRIMVPKNIDTDEVEKIKKDLPKKYTLFERDSYLVFFII